MILVRLVELMEHACDVVRCALALSSHAFGAHDALRCGGAANNYSRSKHSACVCVVAAYKAHKALQSEDEGTQRSAMRLW